MKTILLALAAVLALLIAWLAFWPVPRVRGFSGLREPYNYERALDTVRRTSERDGPDVLPECRTLLLEHGRRTGRVVLYFHGITNCPAQFLALAHELYARGVNVYVPRLPHHGFSDRMTTELSRLEAQELADFADQQLEVARGLGDTVVVTGLSLGGVMTAWLAQEREEVDLAVPIAPLFGPAAAPGSLARSITRAGLAWPDRYLWWDPRKKENVAGPRRVYPRFSTRAMAEIMRLAAAVEDRARRKPPAARAITMVTVGKDPAVSNAAVAGLVRSWQRRAPDRVRAYEFPESLSLGHDLIDPDQPYQRVGVVYPILIDLLLANPR